MKVPMNRTTRRLRRFALAAVSMMAVAGCQSLLVGNGETPPRYTLSPVPGTVAAQTQLAARLVIADPVAEAAFETSRIARSPEPLRYEYFANAEWSDRAPNLFRIFLVRSFENNGRIQAVGDRVTLPIGDFILDTDIRSFHVEMQDGQNIARVAYFARLSDRRNNSIASRLFEVNEPVNGSALPSAVEALNSAVNRVGNETVVWAISEIEQNMQAADVES
ncbi:ABC-type transport auxiliary lipoprotein family protein [Parvularcula sp. IMCC14364]|uniref:ABC-type transport auxiliary lipoprotein family protein n=1 Tax=Parvularcula sp. IMCC14364 TaxID=3067902 RepID=UPI002740D512|nr:ABC-type transport auxiliary lipoprotein family protein [Parvularcula sp. IMCC14364]